MKLILFMALLVAGCAPGRKPLPPALPPTGSLPPPPPQFERTFGNITVGATASLSVTYKSILILIDPNLDAGQTMASSPQTDYVLLTDAAPRHFSATFRSGARKNIKVIASMEESERVRKEGFSEVKGLAPGQRIMLKKDNAFVFVTSVQTHNTVTNLQINSYLLEFDNGRNLFISGEISNIDGLRPFVYDLRDDGKEVYAGFFYRQPEMRESVLAQMMALIQPKNALVIQNDLDGLPPLNQNVFNEALKAELFDGAVLMLQNGKEVPF